MTIRDLGSLARERASVEVMIRFLSISINGREPGLEPVAMMMFFAPRWYTAPLVGVTETE